jgi:outer membrane protein assembly factor BamB
MFPTKKFQQFLKKCGAKSIPTTNNYEVARFVTSDGICVIYHGKKGLKFNRTLAQEVWEAFNNNKPWKTAVTKEKVSECEKNYQERKEKYEAAKVEKGTKPDWSGKCDVCGQSPIVPMTGMCGPCTFGEASTALGNW